MSKDKRWTSAMPNHTDWSKAPQSVRLLAALLYQECSGKDLMEKARLLRVEDLLAPRIEGRRFAYGDSANR